jgi:hypothetical protein
MLSMNSGVLSAGSLSSFAARAVEHDDEGRKEREVEYERAICISSFQVNVHRICLR